MSLCAQTHIHFKNKHRLSINPSTVLDKVEHALGRTKLEELYFKSCLSFKFLGRVLFVLVVPAQTRQICYKVGAEINLNSLRHAQTSQIEGGELRFWDGSRIKLFMGVWQRWIKKV